MTSRRILVCGLLFTTTMALSATMETKVHTTRNPAPPPSSILCKDHPRECTPSGGGTDKPAAAPPTVGAGPGFSGGAESGERSDCSTLLESLGQARADLQRTRARIATMSKALVDLMTARNKADSVVMQKRQKLTAVRAAKNKYKSGVAVVQTGIRALDECDDNGTKSTNCQRANAAFVQNNKTNDDLRDSVRLAEEGLNESKEQLARIINDQASAQKAFKEQLTEEKRLEQLVANRSARSSSCPGRP